MTDASPQKSAYDDLEHKIAQQSRAALWRMLAVTGVVVCAVAGYVWYSYADITSLQSKLVAAQASGAKAVQLAQQVDALQAKMADARKEVSTLQIRAAAVEEARQQIARLDTKLDDARQEVSVRAAAANKAHQQIAFLETKLDAANKETFLLKTQAVRADRMKGEIATLRTNSGQRQRRSRRAEGPHSERRQASRYASGQAGGGQQRRIPVENPGFHMEKPGRERRAADRRA